MTSSPTRTPGTALSTLDPAGERSVDALFFAVPGAFTRSCLLDPAGLMEATGRNWTDAEQDRMRVNLAAGYTFLRPQYLPDELTHPHRSRVRENAGYVLYCMAVIPPLLLLFGEIGSYLGLLAGVLFGVVGSLLSGFVGPWRERTLSALSDTCLRELPVLEQHPLGLLLLRTRTAARTIRTTHVYFDRLVDTDRIQVLLDDELAVQTERFAATRTQSIMATTNPLYTSTLTRVEAVERLAEECTRSDVSYAQQRAEERKRAQELELPTIVPLTALAGLEAGDHYAVADLDALTRDVASPSTA